MFDIDELVELIGQVRTHPSNSQTVYHGLVFDVHGEYSNDDIQKAINDINALGWVKCMNSIVQDNGSVLFIVDWQ